RRDFSRAVSLLEQVARNDPSATAVHYPLAIAYRGAGRSAHADRQLRLRAQRNTDITPLDPLMDRLADLLEGQQAFEVRGTEALTKGEWRKAIATFRRGGAVAPPDP